MTSSNSNNRVNTLHTPSNFNNHSHINTNPFIPLNNNIMPSFPTMPIIPSIPIPIIHSLPAIPITPLQLLPQPQTLTAGVQYFIHPSMPNTPMILVPNILMNINANNNHNKPPPNNAKIRAILSKKKSGSKPLTNQETQILEAAVKSARQQFMSWYQQQVIAQSIPLSLINPIQLQQLQLLRQPPIQTLTPKQMVAIQQQQQLQLQRQQILQLQAQRLQQQQQLLQQQILANNIYNNNNIIYSNNSTANNLAQNNNTPAPLDMDTYFALPKPLEFDDIFYNDDDIKEDNDDAQDNGLLPLFFNDTNVAVHNLCFNIGLCGIGVLSYGGNHYNKSLKTETYNKCKRDNMYKLLGVTDNTNECCEWLIRDLMRSQSEFKSNIEQKCNVMITDIVNNSEYQHEHQPDVKNIVDQIQCAPNITRCLFRKNIYNVYCANNQIVEISHVDILRANIDLIEKCETDTNCNKKAADDEDVTLEFFNLCRCMEAHFNPCNDVETLKHISANSEIFYQTALKLRNNPNYFSIPGLPNKKHIKKNNNININNVNVTNRIINISNLTINTQPNTNNNQWQSFPFINSPGIQFINPIQNNITYPVHSYMPPVVQPSNINIANRNYISSPPATSKQQSHIKQIKIPNAASWNVGGM